MNCNTADCSRPAYVKGLCRRHYHQGKTREWRANNREHSRAQARAYDEKRRKSKTRQIYMTSYLETYLATEHGKGVRREVLRRYQARRTAAQRLATPPWADQTTLTAIYEACPQGFEVDHIVPILGKDVCGLHVPHNLQYLTPSQNAKKGNR